MTRIIIKSRFNGPPDSGNGGYVCGIVGGAIEGPSIVTLRKPPPLERELILETLDERHAVLRDGETVVGETMAQKWPGTTATSIRLPVQDGSITSSFVFCETVGVNVTVVGADEPFGETAPIEGAEVCQDGTDNCAITNVDGEATLQIPGNEEFAYAVTPPSDYFPTLSPQVSDSDIPLTPNVTVFLEATLMGFAALLNTEWPPTTGVNAIVVFQNPFPEAVGMPGVSFELLEGTGEPYYLNESNVPTTMLTETADNGTGGFYEVTEGTVEVGLSGTQNCERPYSAWPGSEPNQFRMPSRTGFFTTAVVWCDAE